MARSHIRISNAMINFFTQDSQRHGTLSYRLCD